MSIMQDSTCSSDLQLKEGETYISQLKRETSCGSSYGTVPEYRTSVINGSGFKRRRTEIETYNMESQLHVPAYTYPTKFNSFVIPEQRNYMPSVARSFLSVRHSPFIYYNEDWKPKGCTMYVPLRDDVMVNMTSIDQISFECDQFFLADDKGNYVGAKQGNAIHLWRFDCSTKKLYISRSILFLKEQEYYDIRTQLELI